MPTYRRTGFEQKKKKKPLYLWINYDHARSANSFFFLETKAVFQIKTIITESI